MVIFFLLLGLGHALPAARIAQEELEVLKSDRSGVEFIYTPVFSVGGYQNISISGGVPQPEPGKPNLPVKYVLIGVPIGAKVEIKVIESITTESSNVYIPPVYSFTEDEIDEVLYSTDAYWPNEVISIDEQALYRTQEVVRLRINPLRYNPKRNTLLICNKLRVSVIFHGGGGTSVIDKHFDPIFKSVLINYEQAKYWRKPRTPKHILYPIGPWYKIELQQEGIYKIGKEQLQGLGIKDVDPRTIKLYNGGSKMVIDTLDTLLKEVPIVVLPDTSIIFYATSLHGWGKNDASFFNPYTDTNVYWLSYWGEAGKRDSVDGSLIPNLPSPVYFIDTLHIEKDELCPAKSGLGWVWERIERPKGVASLKRDYSFNVYGLITDSCKIRVAVYGWYADGTNYAESNTMTHSVRLYLNGVAFFDTSWQKGDRYPRIFEHQATGLKEGTNTFTVEIYESVSQKRDIIFFDWFEVIFKKKYKAHAGDLKFSCTGRTQRLELSGFNEIPIIFETTNPLSPRKVYGAVFENGVVKFKATAGRYYAAVAQGIKTLSAHQIKKESPYNLRNRTGELDFIIISPPEFLSYANALKTHRQKQGLLTEVFSIEDIYNNFSWGQRHSPYSIRNFLTFAYENWGVSYCLLFGAGTYAYKNEGLEKNRIPPWESGYIVGEFGYPPQSNQCYDHWFTTRNMAIGRITAANKEEARDVIVEKIIKYEQNPGVWQNRILLIADDENSDKPGLDGCGFIEYMEPLERRIPPACDIFKIYLMNYSIVGKEKPTARYDLIREWSKGHFLNFYAGHGNLLQLCHEILMYNPRDIEALNNGIKLPISHFSSCGVGNFDREYQVGMGEYLQKLKYKGSIATLSETRMSTLRWDIADKIVKYSLTNPQRRIGQVVYGVNLELRLPVNCNLFADPTTLLPSRTLQVTIDSCPDTLIGGRTITISGTAMGANFAHITVRSSEYTYTYTYIVNNARRTCSYKMRGRLINEQLCEDILFEGTVKVENGKWRHEFFIPVELDSILCGGNGKISVFAWKDASEVGSISRQVAVIRGVPNPLDSLGPMIELYANGRLIRDGDLVPSEFILTGVLEDESGINTFNKIRPYDLALRLQVNSEDPKSIADYFQYDIGSGTRGSFNYPLKLDPYDIEEDTIFVQASDNSGNNNRTVRRVIVKVMSSERLEIRRVINYPNPVRGEHTAFTFLLSKPATVTVKIYTISGRLIRTITGLNKGPGMNQIYWDTRDELGNRVGNGIYIYKIEAISEGLTKEETSQVSKLMILR